MDIYTHPLETVLRFRYITTNEHVNGNKVVSTSTTTKLAVATVESDMDVRPLDANSFKLLPGINDFVLHVAHDIPKFQCVLEYVGTVRDGGLANYHSVPLTNESFIDTSNSGNIARYACYSCDPNCYLDEKWIDGECKIFLYSSRLIKMNEALTFRFNYQYKEDEIQLKCHCNSKKCMGKIGRVAQDEFNCGICGKVFTRKGNLLDHLSVHDKDRPSFHCQECNKSYVDKRGLNRHIKIRHESSTPVFKCNYCGRTYLRKDTLDAHKKNAQHKG